MYLILKFIFNVINLDSEKGLFHGGATVREEDIPPGISEKLSIPCV